MRRVRSFWLGATAVLALGLVVAPVDGRPPKKRGGRLPPEVIQRVVRQNFGRFRRCYEDGLRCCPNLQGRVAVRFVIATDGSVASARDAGSDVPDAAIVACVVRAFRTLTFPKPEGGPVTVVYPIMFAPGE